MMLEAECQNWHLNTSRSKFKEMPVIGASISPLGLTERHFLYITKKTSSTTSTLINIGKRPDMGIEELLSWRVQGL